MRGGVRGWSWFGFGFVIFLFSVCGLFSCFLFCCSVFCFLFLLFFSFVLACVRALFSCFQQRQGRFSIPRETFNLIVPVILPCCAMPFYLIQRSPTPKSESQHNQPPIGDHSRVCTNRANNKPFSVIVDFLTNPYARVH